MSFLCRITAFACALLTGLLWSRVSFGQKRPFPQNGGYAHGFVPSNISAKDALSSYTAWKAKYLKNDCGDGYYRVEFGSPRGTTVSEGQGYGMVLTVYFGDKTQFDGLWKFARKNTRPDLGLMGWKVNCGGFDKYEGGGGGTATDGDTDIGFALVAAVDQWGDEYRQPALEYLGNLKRVDFTTCKASGRVMSTAGNWGGGCDFSNTSYFMPGYYRVFAQFSGDPFWTKAADDAEALYLLSRDPSTGLMPNEVDERGAPHDNEVYVDYNGCRTPWRAAADYLWYGTPEAKSADDKMTEWVDSIGIGKVVDGYFIDGRPKGKYTQQNPWVGGWACGAMTKSQEIVNRFAADFKSIDDDEGGYYGSSLRSLYLLMLSGNFWRPGNPAPGGDLRSSMDAGMDAGATIRPGEGVPVRKQTEAPADTAQSGPPTSALPPKGCGACSYGSQRSGPAVAVAFSAMVALALRRKRSRRRLARSPSSRDEIGDDAGNRREDASDDRGAE